MRAVSGVVQVMISGPLSGRDLTRLTQQMVLYGVRRVGQTVTFSVSVRDVYRLRGLLRGSGCTMRILKRQGLPFFRVFLRRHSAFVILLIASLITLWGMTRMVYEVKVSGAANPQQEQQMLDYLHEQGVRKGVMIASIDRNRVEQAVLEAFPDLTFAALRPRGVLMELKVVYATPAPNVFDKNEPVDIVASRGGLVTTVTVLSGKALVRPGDTVREGQVLIEGYNETTGSRHASGSVFARSWQRGMGTADLTETVRERTGNSYIRTRIKLFGYTFPQRPDCPYAAYDLEKKTSYLLDGLFLPIATVRETLYEVKLFNQPRDAGLVRQQAYQRALGDALNLVPNGASVVDKRIEYSKIKDDKLLATLTMETVSQIGTPVQRSGVDEGGL